MVATGRSAPNREEAAYRSSSSSASTRSRIEVTPI
jgi:hypothetical protein